MKVIVALINKKLYINKSELEYSEEALMEIDCVKFRAGLINFDIELPNDKPIKIKGVRKNAVRKIPINASGNKRKSRNSP